MRYAAGAILSEGPKDKIDPDIRKAMEAAGFKVMELPEMKNCVRTTFPFLNKISLFFAYTRVYPKLMRYVEVNMFHFDSLYLFFKLISSLLNCRKTV